MTQIGRHFCLSLEPSRGVFCDRNGVFVGGVPLLERRRNSSGADEWHPRPAAEINRNLSKQYGMIIEIQGKMAGLATVCRALNRGDLIHAQIALLHLQIPDPPFSSKSSFTAVDRIHLAPALQASGLLKIQEVWDEGKHPRWPAGSPGSVGGQFAPADTGSVDATSTEQVAAEQSAPITTAQSGAIVAPRYGPIPFPREIPPIPLSPDISPRREIQNPYPDRPECQEEWEHAFKYCWNLVSKGLLGTDGYRGAGSSFSKCVLGQVSEACGGNPTA